jgi:glycosyltransferase involved in cell wall biosynthesis
MIANIRKPKGYEFFVRAARRVADRMPEARFVAVGDIDKDLGPPLRALVDQLGLQDQFFFVGSRPDVPEVLSSLDLFVLSSLSEGLPLVTLEAMAAGKPVVVTNTGGTSEVVQDSVTGFLVPPGDANALAARMCQLLENPVKAADMGAHARERVESQFTIPQMVQRYEQLYESVLA